ncbi:hypothetical protein HDV05_002188 [Chytridiales sp. JEL 0842]|nr:hypothetical protein HDV05_002188 [Chytridiales sp. JEL 0842]
MLGERFQDNVYILRGYRKLQYSYYACFKSLFYLHNETWNIYTHLTAILIFTFLSYTTYNHLKSSTNGAHLGDYIVFSVLVVASTLATFVPTIYYGFYCAPQLQQFYITVLAALTLLAVFITISPRFSTPKYRYLRISIFMTLGMCGIVPTIHTAFKYGYQYFQRGVGGDYVSVASCLYLIGAVTYASHMPERWFPGSFDLSLHSHALMHIIVTLAAVTHYFGVVESFKFWNTVNDRCQIAPAELMGYLSGLGV